MVDLNHKLNWQQFLVLAIVIGAAIATPMYYKKKDGDTYEPDLIPISSTVIPLLTYHVNSTGTFKHHSLPLSEEYRIAYMKILHKKMAKDAEDPDTLITLTKKYHPDKKVRVHNGSVAKIESIDVSRE